MRLSEFPAFERLSAAQLADLGAAGEERDVPPGTDIIVMGGRGDSLFLLLEGSLAILRVEGQDERKLADVAPPAVFGEMEFLTAAPRTATVRATTPARVFALPFAELQRRLDDGDVAALQLVRSIAVVVAKRLAATVTKLYEIEDESAGKRKAELRDFRHKLFSNWSF